MSDATIAERYGYGKKNSLAEVPVHNAAIPSAETDGGNPPASEFDLPAGFPTAAGPVYRAEADSSNNDKTGFASNDIRSQNPNYQPKRS
jgi:hypothetical protein